MMMYWASQILNGLSFGMLLFFLAAGLTLTLGVMRVVNLTHGSFYLLGAYVALDVVAGSNSFLFGSIVAAVAVAALGAVVFILLQATGTDPLRQTLLTFGLIFVIADFALVQWGGSPMSVKKPSFLTGPVEIGDFVYPSYRLFIIAFGLVIAAILGFLQRYTLIGAMVRATVDDTEMANGVGLNSPAIAVGTFLTGAALAGLSGAMGGALVGAYPGADIQVLLFALVIVIVGGMGSLAGSFFGALAVGLLDTFGRVLVPQLGASLMFALMLVMLIVRPNGLFGRPE
jgi:branched-chain amino acid transport system permease protein